MSFSPLEKEKLRKRLQKLFQKQEALQNLTNCKFKISSQQDKMSNTQRNKTSNQKPVKATNSLPIKKGTSKNELKQNGFVNAQENKNSVNNSTKEVFVLKKVKQTEKLQTENSSIAKNTPKPESVSKNTSQSEIKKHGGLQTQEKQNSHINSIKTERLVLKKDKQQGKLQADNKSKAKNIKKIFSKPDSVSNNRSPPKITKAPEKQNSINKSKIFKEDSLKKDKQKDSKKSSIAKNTKEKISSKPQSVSNDTGPPKMRTVKLQLNESTKLNKNKVVESRTQKNVPKAHQPSTFKQSDSAASGHSKINKVQKKKAKKRLLSDAAVSNKPVVSNKKQKFNKKSDKVNKNKKHKFIPLKADSSSSEYEDEYNINDMTGYVGGGDFDTNCEENEMDQKHCMEDENEYSSDNILEEQNEMIRFENRSPTDRQQYDHNESYDSSVDNFDEDDSSSDSEDDYCSDSYEEEEENYSDFNENDYEEDEDSYDYTMDNDDISSNYDEYDDSMYYDFDDSDEDYELPRHIPEDLIIHKGTANKRDIKPEDNVSFDNDDSQIVELEDQLAVKVIYQPKAYEKEQLLKLKYEVKSSVALAFHKKESICSDSDDCPKLIPIVDKDGFQLYNSNDEVKDSEQEETEEESLDEYENDSMDDSLGSEYTEIDSDDGGSSLSEDINEKYLNKGDVDSDSSSIDESMWKKKHKVDIIDATGYKVENMAYNSIDGCDNNLNCDRETPSFSLYENVDINTECTILSATVVDNKLTDENLEEINLTTASKHEVIENLQMEKETTGHQSPKDSKCFAQNLRNYNTKFFNAFESNLVMVLLKDPFYIYGTVRLTLLSGAVEVYGHKLRLNEEVEIFSPRGCSVLEISAFANPTCNISKYNLQEILKPYEGHFALADLKRISSLYDSKTDAVVLLKRNEARKKVIQQFKKFMNENVFPNIGNINVDRPLYNSEYLLRCMINISAEEQKCLRLPEQWEELSISPKSRVMLTGGKGVGKSTLLRYLINRNLPQEILLIDLDIGQPEVFTPQTISCTVIKQPLLGPGFFLNLQPDLAFAVGHTNIALCAHKYINAVRGLIAHCRKQEEYREIPWLINTMGYNKGFGLELISVIAKELALTDLIQVQSDKEINNFDIILDCDALSSVPHNFFPEEYNEKDENMKENLKYRLHVLQSAVQQESRYQKEWIMSAKDLRFAMLLVRLSDALQGHADWLTDIKPLSASLDEIKIVNLLDSSSSTSVEELEKSLEANLVYLCQHEDDLNALKCLGIGVVRAIDFHVRQLYLIPALPHALFKNVNCLAIGEMPLPTSLFTNQGPKVKNTAPFVYNTVAANASKAIKQIYHRPRKFLKGNHKVLD